MSKYRWAVRRSAEHYYLKGDFEQSLCWKSTLEESDTYKTRREAWNVMQRYINDRGRDNGICVVRVEPALFEGA